MAVRKLSPALCLTEHKLRETQRETEAETERDRESKDCVET